MKALLIIILLTLIFPPAGFIIILLAAVDTFMGTTFLFNIGYKVGEFKEKHTKE